MSPCWRAITVPPREDVELFVAEPKAAGFKDTEISCDKTVDGDHGRIETRTTTVIHHVASRQKAVVRILKDEVVIISEKEVLSPLLANALPVT
jgi:hypothetical protein